MYHAMHLILDDIEARNAPLPKGLLLPAAAAAWRFANDQFAFWKLCANRRCRRARRCCGEPRACFDRHLPHVPENARKRVLAELRARHKPREFVTAPLSPPPSGRVTIGAGGRGSHRWR